MVIRRNAQKNLRAQDKFFARRENIRTEPTLNTSITMSDSILDSEDRSTLEYIITHVFFPLQLPDKDDQGVSNDRSLTGAIAAAARLYTVHTGELPQWHCILRMLDNLHATVHSRNLDRSLTYSQFQGMNVGGEPFSFYHIAEPHDV